MTRAYFTTNVEQTRDIFADGWQDCYEEFGMCGVYFSTRPLDANDGFDGNVTLCLDAPDALFDRFDVTDEVHHASGYRLALIPASELNLLGKPQVYDHYFAGGSRRELVQAIRVWEDYPEANHPANEIREAIVFFDGIGWLTPLKLKEEAEKPTEGET